MTKQEILDDLYKSDKASEILTRVPDSIRDDLKQEVFIILLLKPDVEILNIWGQGKIYSFFSKIVYNQLFWTRSNFHKLYKTGTEVPTESFPDLPDLLEYDINSDVENAMNSLSQYHNKILRMYAEIGTFRDTGAALDIAWKSVYNAVEKAKKQVKTKLNKTL